MIRPMRTLLQITVWSASVALTASAIAQPATPSQSAERSIPEVMPVHKPLVIALIGDQPYGSIFESATDQVIKAVNDAPDVQWILHVGDIKSGGTRCTDALIKKRVAQMNSSKKALVYTPGDNEWTDCHRDWDGNYNSQERLRFLRTVAFSQPESLGQHPIKVLWQQQAGFPENFMWREGGTLFLTVNVPGSNNNLDDPSSRKESQETIEKEFKTRQAAIQAWLDKAAATFKEPNPPTETVIAMQGNPLDGSGTSWLGKLWKVKDGYAPLMKSIAQYIDSTNRPLLLAHGDTHHFVFDQPSLKRFDPNFNDSKKLFYRAEGWGHPFYNEWVKVTIHSGSPTPFKAVSVPIQTGP